MSYFMNIKDPQRRDAMFKDYLTTIKQIKKRNEEDRRVGLSRQRKLEEHFKPVVKSHEKMTKEITTGLVPLKGTISILQGDDEKLRPHKRRRVDIEYGHDDDGHYGPLARSFKRKILARDPDVDTSFGIYFTLDGRTAMGNKYVTIDGNDIIVGGRIYTGTKGLWSLITGVTKRQIGEKVGQKFTRDDIHNYITLLSQTNVLHKDFEPKNPYPRSNASWKWKHFLKNIWQQLKEQNEVRDESDESDSDGSKEVIGQDV